MKLFIDAGNTRLKWCLDDQDCTLATGTGSLEDENPLSSAGELIRQVRGVAISTVASEERRTHLMDSLAKLCPAPVKFYWSEQSRNGLVNAYQDVSRMGADRWHAMYGAWLDHKQGFVVVDAGSAVTIDYVDTSGQHLGGYILPGLQMMLRSLRTDAARIWFDPDQGLATDPGRNTGECVNHGLAWLSGAMIERVIADARKHGLSDLLVTGGDANRLIGLGLPGTHRPDLVLSGLRAIHAEDSSE
ncbi:MULTISPECIES: type III pantothenate kinase [Marinobacter]|jgi:type III pantothenate kinase|uniref:Type III pantothenate kinase n=1 Tax=Marinobacter sp. MMG032 TaxID=3158548 RepID=A0AAU7MRC2_9GAMM|nr:MULTISPECIES: type III pantothenate kinase [Marinobacter]MBO6813203.1 type III pantothenate kinase [Marinobacter sp.]MBO6874018.1 type III pantothenate kinase [Marinobacter sp.]QTN41987.1 type III pantothenate kinase [Marinobacter salsuginis]